MPRTDAIHVEGVVVATMPNGTCQVELSNGHRLLAWGARKAGLTDLASGQKVNLELSPFDLSTGRIVGAEKR